MRKYTDLKSTLEHLQVPEKHHGNIYVIRINKKIEQLFNKIGFTVKGAYNPFYGFTIILDHGDQINFYNTIIHEVIGHKMNRKKIPFKSLHKTESLAVEITLEKLLELGKTDKRFLDKFDEQILKFYKARTRKVQKSKNPLKWLTRLEHKWIYSRVDYKRLIELRKKNIEGNIENNKVLKHRKKFKNVWNSKKHLSQELRRRPRPY